MEMEKKGFPGLDEWTGMEWNNGMEGQISGTQPPPPRSMPGGWPAEVAPRHGRRAQRRAAPPMMSAGQLLRACPGRGQTATAAATVVRRGPGPGTTPNRARPCYRGHCRRRRPRPSRPRRRPPQRRRARRVQARGSASGRPGSSSRRDQPGGASRASAQSAMASQTAICSADVAIVTEFPYVVAETINQEPVLICHVAVFE